MALMAGLKIQRKWINKMRKGIHCYGKRVKKSMEVRTYLPSQRTPRNHPAVQIGDRIFLLSNGSICGSAKLESVVVFNTENDFAASEHLHCISLTDIYGIRIQEVFHGGSNVFGWQLCDFHWMRPELRSGVNCVPDFKGQRYGQVWSTVRIDDMFDRPTHEA